MVNLQPDLIHVHVAGEYANAAASCETPWVLTLHGIRFLEVDLWRDFLSRYYRGWFIKREERKAIDRAEHVISISPYIHSVFNGQLQGQVYDIENPIDPAFFQVPLERKPYQLLFVGRLIPRKGVHTLLRAFALLHQKIPEATLRLAGEGGFSNEKKTYPQQLKQFISEAGLEEAVSFLGPIDKPTLLQEYRNCAVLVVPSVQETAPMVIMEGLAAGNAVVSTDAGGARFLVESGQTGYIVPVNDEEALAESLYQVLGDQEKLAAMSNWAREHASQRFHADIVAAKTREVYYRILGRPTP
jgi:glycosyltransferase involved in cell wall biosynthesis